MNTIYRDSRRVVVSITMEQGTNVTTFCFGSGEPSEGTLTGIVQAMIDGYKMIDYETVPVHEIEKET